MLRSTLAALAVVALLSTGVACSDDAPPANKDANVDVHKQPDTGPRLDTGKKDTFMWPDSSDQGTPDVWPTPETYSGTPFGCTADADCFGLKCCSTPWGVKICAQACN